jgi:hypothetical protein
MRWKMAKTFKKYTQLSLFDSVVIRNDHLMATRSPRKAVYNMWLIQAAGKFIVKKESGCEMKKQTARQWSFPDLGQAEHFYEKKIKTKTNPDRKSRVYEPVGGSIL